MSSFLFFKSGIKIAGGRSTLGADFGIFIKKILSGGVADLDGKDECLECQVLDNGLREDQVCMVVRT